MTVNQKMFGEIHRLLVEFPELHDQQGWEASPEDTGKCGTTRCVAGWATWLAARDHGLLSKKRQNTNTDVRTELAEHLGLHKDAPNGWYYEDHPANSYPVIGGHLLGLSDEQAHALFHDMNQERVVARVKSFAETGEDISDEEYLRLA